MTRTSRAIATLALLTVVSGCGSGSAPRLSLRDQRLTPPITAAMYAVDDVNQAVNAAEHVLIRACMHAKGFKYLGSAAYEKSDAPTPFGLETLVQQNLAAGAPAARTEVPQGEAYTHALYGDENKRVSIRGAGGMEVSTPGNGCLAEAETRLLGRNRTKLTSLKMQLHQAASEATSRLAQDKEYRQAAHDWSDCMKKAGFTVQSPTQLRGTLSDKPLSQQPVARADVACKTQTDFLTRAYQRLAKLQQSQLDQHPGLLEAWRKLLKDQKSAARDVLASGG